MIIHTLCGNGQETWEGDPASPGQGRGLDGIRYWPRPAGGKVTNHPRLRLGSLACSTINKQTADKTGFEAANNPLNAAQLFTLQRFSSRTVVVEEIALLKL